MTSKKSQKKIGLPMLARRAAVVCLTALAAGNMARADDDGFFFGFQFWPGNLVVSRSVYDTNPKNIPLQPGAPACRRIA